MPYRDADGNGLMAVVLELDGADILKRAGGPSLPLEVYGYAFGADGTVKDVVSLSATLDLAKLGPRIQHGLQAHALFRLPPGRHSLRFLVRDATSGRQGVRWMDVDMPAFGERCSCTPPSSWPTPRSGSSFPHSRGR